MTIADAPNGSAAPESCTGSLVYDAKRSRYLSVCGHTNTGPNCNLSAYTEATGVVTVAVAAGTKPKARDGFHYAMDAVNDRVVIFGGGVASGTPPVIGDTWALSQGSETAGPASMATSGRSACRERTRTLRTDRMQCPICCQTFREMGTAGEKQEIDRLA